MRSMVFAVMTALEQIEPESSWERITGSEAKRRAAGKDFGGRRPTVIDDQSHSAARPIKSGKPAFPVVRVWGMSRATAYRRIRGLS